jgi:hypothetical protein
MSYTKADLLWEATRRNENYKKFYFEVAKSSQSKKDIWNKFWHPGNYQWKVDGLLDPSISSDEINTQIIKGALRNDFHPYYYILSKSKVNQHIPPKWLLILDAQLTCNPNNDDLAELLNWLRLKVFNDSNRILISFDIFENDEVIFGEIKKIKRNYRVKVRDDTVSNKTIEKRLYNPQKINHYLEWIKKYDEVIDYFKKLPDAKFSIEKGATILNQKINFNIVAPIGSLEKDSVKERESQTKKYKEAFEGAVLLIQSTPNIIFNIPRIERLS